MGLNLYLPELRLNESFPPKSTKTIAVWSENRCAGILVADNKTISRVAASLHHHTIITLYEKQLKNNSLSCLLRQFHCLENRIRFSPINPVGS